MLQEVFNFLDSKKIGIDFEKSVKVNDLKEYFEDFFQNYPQTNLLRVSSLSDKQIMIPLLILNNPYKLKEILDVLKKYPDLFKNDKCPDMIIGFSLYYNKEYFRDLIKQGKSFNPFVGLSAVLKLAQIASDFGLPPKALEFLDFFKKHPQAEEDLKILFTGFSAQYHNVGTYFMDERDCYIYNNAKVNLEDQEIADFSREERRIYKKMFNTKKETTQFSNAVINYFNFLRSKLKEIVKEYEKGERERISHNQNIEELKKMLDTTGEIRDIDTILRLCSSDKIKVVVVNYIIKHNKEIYIKLAHEYELVQKNSDENLTILFNNYGFDYSNLTIADKTILKKLNYLEIEDLLKKLSLLGLNNVNVSKISLDKLSIITELIFKGLITKEWLQANEDLLYADNIELDRVINNIDLLAKEGINLIQYHNSLDIIRSSFLKSNLSLLKDYDLVISRTTTDINFLSASDLRLRIEFIYSLGLHLEFTDLNILNNSLDTILKLKVTNFLNIPIENITGDIYEIYCDFDTDIIPKYIKAKLNQESEFITEIPSFLKEYYNDKQTLNINGVRVSITKIKRNLAKIGDISPISCFYAIIYNGYYTYEEIMSLQVALIPEVSLFTEINQVRS